MSELLPRPALQEPQDLSLPLVLLASQSPRRRALLQSAGLAFELVPPGDETTVTWSGDADELDAYVRARAAAKARGAELGGRFGVLLAVDTIVTLDGRLFEKPRDRDDARVMLETLFGREHVVRTAHAFVDATQSAPPDLEHPKLLVSSARVALEPQASAELEAYLDRGDWIDKAGGYGIQSDASAFAELVSGAFDTVVGLDVELVRAELESYR